MAMVPEARYAGGGEDGWRSMAMAKIKVMDPDDDAAWAALSEEEYAAWVENFLAVIRAHPEHLGISAQELAEVERKHQAWLEACATERAARAAQAAAEEKLRQTTIALAALQGKPN